jgi:hypothetical protein
MAATERRLSLNFIQLRFAIVLTEIAKLPMIEHGATDGRTRGVVRNDEKSIRRASFSSSTHSTHRLSGTLGLCG